MLQVVVCRTTRDVVRSCPFLLWSNGGQRRDGRNVIQTDESVTVEAVLRELQCRADLSTSFENAVLWALDFCQVPGEYVVKGVLCVGGHSGVTGHAARFEWAGVMVRDSDPETASVVRATLYAKLDQMYAEGPLWAPHVINVGLPGRSVEFSFSVGCYPGDGSIDVTNFYLKKRA